MNEKIEALNNIQFESVGSAEEAVIDLLIEARQFCRTVGLDYNYADEMAKIRFEDE